MLNSIFGGNNKKSITITREEFDNLKGQVEAISRSQAVIEFKTDGTIIVANDNFLQAMGYSLSDIVGKHHSMFVETAERNSRDYSEFWASLARGEFQAREFKRVANGGREIWIQASYNPIFDKDGNVFKVVKYASDITESKLRNADYKNQIQAIGRSQAVIEFDLEGRVVEANENFLQTLGYTINEIRGQHHSMFVPSEIAHTNEYKDFWASLKRGDFQSGEFERRDKSGQSIWIQASYNPIRDMNGNPVKVVKYASDITATKTMQMTVEKLVTEVASVMDCLAEGDLNKTVTGDYGPQFAELTGNVNSTVERLIQVSQSIKGSASTVSETAQEMSQSNMDLSGRTEQQAYSLEKTAASVEEITGIVQSNAQDAEEANHLAVEARNEAEKGGDVVRRAVDAMTQINDSSQEIADIIGVIDEIAFQTNLLALNASVEAARAGEQGRGFSVVASEVRNLAGRSATAAKEIKELIQDSVNKVNTGSSLVNDSGVVLDEIVGRVKKVASIIERISTASQEQAQGLTEINQAMNQMDQATQQNAALVEETAAVSETALQEADSLVKLVSFFSYDDAPAGKGYRSRSNAPSGAQFTGNERRTAERPWAKTSEGAAPARQSASTGNEQRFDSKVAAGGEWAEF